MPFDLLVDNDTFADLNDRDIYVREVTVPALGHRTRSALTAEQRAA